MDMEMLNCLRRGVAASPLDWMTFSPSGLTASRIASARSSVARES